MTRSGFYAWQRPAGIGARAAGSAAEGAGARVVRRQQGPLRQPARFTGICSSRTERVSRKRVIRLMQEEGLKARVRETVQVHDDERSRPAGRGESAGSAVHGGAPNQRWVGDTTEFVIGESGKLYLAAILDLFSRFIVGWAVSAVNDRHLTIKALEMALKRRCPEAGLLHHSDQGCTYASEDYQRDPRRARHHLQHEPTRQLLRQRRDGELLLHGEERAGRSLRQLRRGQDGVVRLHRGVLQPAAPPLDARPNQSGRLRTTRGGGVAMTGGRSVAATPSN